MAKYENPAELDYRNGGDTVDDFAQKYMRTIAYVFKALNDLRTPTGNTAGVEPEPYMWRIADNKLYIRNGDNTDYVLLGEISPNFGFRQSVNDRFLTTADLEGDGAVVTRNEAGKVEGDITGSPGKIADKTIDVTPTADNDVIAYDAAQQKWVKKTLNDYLKKQGDAGWDEMVDEVADQVIEDITPIIFNFWYLDDDGYLVPLVGSTEGGLPSIHGMVGDYEQITARSVDVAGNLSATGNVTAGMLTTPQANVTTLTAAGTLTANDIIAKGPIVDVRAFGAVGDGAHDDTAAIQAAIDNNTNAIIYIPAGTYKVLTLTLKNGSKIFGVQNATIISSITNRTHNCITIDGVNEAVLRNLIIEGYDEGLHLNTTKRCIFDNIKCHNNNYGMKIEGNSWIHRFYNCVFNDNTYDGVACGLDNDSEISTLDFFSCYFYGNSRNGFSGSVALTNFFGGFSESNKAGFEFVRNNRKILSGITLVGVDIESNYDYGVTFTGEEEATIASDFKIIGGMIVGRSSGIACVNFGVEGEYNGITLNCRFANDGYTYFLKGNNATVYGDIPTNLKTTNTSINGLLLLQPNLNTITSTVIPLTSVSCIKYDGTNIVLQPNERITLNVPHLKYINSMVVKTTSTSGLTVNCSGRKVRFYESTKQLYITPVNGVITYNLDTVAEVVTIHNPGGDERAITEISINGKFENI